MLTSADAAARLGVTAHEVRRLVHAGVLRGRRLGRQLIVDEASVEARATTQVRPGRALTPANAWAVLFVLSGEQAPWMAASTRSRLLGRWLGDVDARALAVACRHRASRHPHRVLPAYRDRVLAEPGVVPTGMSSATAVDVDIVAVDPVAEAYCSPDDLDALTRRYALSDEGRPNVLLRVPSTEDDNVLRLLLDRRTMPSAVTAADLMESDDPRTRRAGQRLLDQALTRFRSP
ncbi:MAG: helix-turn-helix domain-containing protein [Kineosporiaceae bacterium]